MMIVSESAARSARGSVVPQFLRFCIVGAAGFVVDAGVLLAIVSLGVLGPFSARLISFSLAVMTTFALNRRWSFEGGAALPLWPTFLSYLGVQGTGFACNFTAYSVLYLLLPAPIGTPLFCLGMASAVSMVINFVGARIVVFKANFQHPRQTYAPRRSKHSKHIIGPDNRAV